MSHRATNWAVEQRGIKPISKVLLWHLADRHHPDNGCFPSQAALALDCEISRASVNRHLDELEALGLIRREPRIDPATKKQLPTRYVLAFEDDFGTPDVVGRVSESDTEPCLKNDDSRVSKSADPVSQSYETLTCKGTSNLTGKAPERATFDQVWEAYPRRKLTSRTEAEAAFNDLAEDERNRCLIAAKRYAQWHAEDSAARQVDPEAQCEFRKALGRWIRSGAWTEALSLPLRSDPVTGNDDLVVLPSGHPDFAAVERMRGKPIITGKNGTATFRRVEVDQAKSMVAA
jgi:DNA-binding transcriptional MocR family regulator